MKRLALALAAVLVGLSLVDAGSVAEDEVKGAKDVPSRIAKEALAVRPTYRMLEELCETAPHRLCGSKGFARAVDWAERTMKAAGLENVRRELCAVPRWERGKTETLEILGAPGGDSPRLSILAIGGSVATPEAGIEAEVLEVKSFEELREKAATARGRIVFFNRPMDPGLENTFAAYGGAADQRVGGASEAAKAGAVAVVVRSLTTKLDDVPHTGTLRYRDDVARIPAVAVSTKGAERLAGLLADGKAVRLRVRLDCRWHEDVPGHNVVGELRGREKPDEILVVGGHLDSWDVGEGAHDDGAGCCQSIAAVAILKKLGLRPRRTIRVVLFANEENGSRGARAYPARHRDEMEKHVLALESDRGGFEPRGFTTNAGPDALATLQKLAEPLRSLGIEWVRRGGTGVDIAPMGRYGVVLVGFVPEDERYFDYHHSARDTFETVDAKSLERGTAAIASLLHAVADLPAALPRVEEKDED